RSPEGTQILARRAPGAWSSKSIVTPSKNGEGFPSQNPQEDQLFSPDLALPLVQPFAGLNQFREPPLVPGVAEEEQGIWRRSNATCESSPASCYQPLITDENNL